jgi:hypothetical protein
MNRERGEVADRLMEKRGARSGVGTLKGDSLFSFNYQQASKKFVNGSERIRHELADASVSEACGRSRGAFLVYFWVSHFLAQALFVGGLLIVCLTFWFFFFVLWLMVY